jgi:hypothetical protein
MKKLALATAAVLALLSIAGCGSYVGKGKAHRRSSRRAKWLHQLGAAGAGFAPALFLLAVPRGRGSSGVPDDLRPTSAAGNGAGVGRI